MTPLTVGRLRTLIRNLPDDAVVLPDWAKVSFSPRDDDPGVEIWGASLSHGRGRGSIFRKPYLSIHVALFRLED